MASPMPSAPMGNWGGNGQAIPPPPFTGSVESGDGGVIIKTMGLKVTYVFADSGESFLARYPELLTVRTVSIDDKLTVGMVDLQMCVRAVVKCSPELLSNATRDFAVYAYDYSEPDEPLVGQGLLGWIINNSDGKQIIGRATRNPLSAFSNGIKEILEIKLKLKPVAAMAQPHYEPEPRPDLRHSYQRSESHASVEIQPARPAEGALTPSSHAEWNSFMQANPQMSNQHHTQTVASPHQPSMHPDFQHQPYFQRSNSFTYNAPQPLPPPQQQQQQQQQNLPQHPQHPQPQPQPQPPMQNSDGPNRVAPIPVDTATETQVNPPSRPSSRASNTSRKSRATGRPRGRPRKQPRAESQGHTSGYEDGTDGDDGPAKKKRATVMTQVTSNINAPFGGGPESLRVTASTAGSLRTLRPMGISTEAPMGSHMQDVPRAPTPVPERGPTMPQTGKPANGSKLRRQSTLSQAVTPPGQPQYPEPPFALSPSQQDGRSPDSDAVSPAYSDDSPAAIGSSPPVPRNTRFVRSSPPASSPILPPMPMPQPDSGFMSGGVDDVFEADGARLQLPKPVTLPPARTSNSNTTKQRSTQPQIPVYTFHLATQPSSEMDPASNNKKQQVPPRPQTSTLPLESSLPLQRTACDPTVTLPPPLQSAEKEPSPQQQEHVVAANPDVQTDSQIAPKLEAGLPGECLDTGLQTLAQAVRNMSPETVLPDPQMDPAMSATFARPSASPSLSRSNSSGFSLALPSVPASDPIGPVALPAPALPQATCFSEAPCPPSDALQPPRSPPQPSKSNKNYVKKQAIREKLLQAIASGQTPMYCSNCGAIETPTWRKIWSQEHEGVPEFTEFSDKPGRITAILVLDRDADEKPTRYQIIKKTLSPHEDKADWKDHMLCNPCGIWLTKWKSHRPQEKWEKDGARLGQQRRARGTGRAPRPPKTKKSGSANPLNPTSEAYFTDPIGPDDRGASPMDESRSRGVSQFSNVNDASQRSMSQFSASQPPEYYGSQPTSPGNVSNPGSTHSRGSGTAKSPITIDNTDVQGMGATRRLLFPSPRKGGVSKALGELAVNVVQTVLEPNPSVVAAQNKEVTIKEHGEGATSSGGSGANKENLAVPDDDALEDLFRSPGIARPSTPPPRERAANNGPFKTPTRPTPSHRPITRSVTRSVSRSLRSGDVLRSPAAVRRTPTRTPRSAKNPIRRSPRLHHDEFTQMELALEEYLQTQPIDHQYDSDMLEAMNRALAESVNTAGSNFDITSMVLDSNCQLEFGDLLGQPSRPTPRPARQQASDYEDWDTWENNVRTRQTADDTKNQ
ncbi:hypothetical protein CTA2_3627 [Colletotrichum tanaceti]|uniref:Ams2/SPT21 N-terminal domain-containing protein n=1 Tax=Colletotrichum tanaceti TaxID=1306861 RepID=A0A4U6XQR7_9PEZI|nr:hypothetical protein CTA2_3627 [Colletotrichum tanaceti]TKW58142.1 hypothetical protein CTA1_7909 [Colletotrichum tanaceti]